MKKNALRLLLSAVLFAALLVAFAVVPPVAQADTGSNWTGYYWNNNNFTGNPTVTRTDPVINFNWGTGSPDPAIPPDNFSVRWYNTITFAAGTYTFRAGAEDGIRVAIDGNIILNAFVASSTFNVTTATVSLGAGSHQIIVDYVNYSGPAGVLFDWTQTGAAPNVTGTPGIVPTAVPAGPPVKAVVIASIANVRSAPNLNSTIVTQIFKDEVYPVIAGDGKGNWFEIRLPTGALGWVFHRVVYLYNGDPGLLPVTTSGVTPPAPLADVQGVANSPLVVRDGPSRLNSQKIGALNQGQGFKILQLSRTHAWVYIDADGLKGWVFLPYITVVTGDLGGLPVSPLPK
ncbi:MAG TPA: PA14 domain-containing protein [Aggregatilineales bacterium]|nr:PA14 domain-containing protein [Aggregatilineales bacterium]